MPSNQESKTVSRLYSAAILGTSVLVPALLLGRVVLNLRRLSYMSHIEGAWLACAFDFVHGVLYRPLFGPLGYGGTRFFPLYFVLTGSLSRIFGRLENSGLILSAASVILLGYGCFVLLRRLEVSWLLSVAAGIAVLVAATTQEALLQTKGDGLAAMLNLWGIVLCVGSKNEAKRGWLYVAAVLFSLAFAAKLTTIFGFASVILVWAIGHRYKEVFRLGLATGFGYVLVVSAMYFGSGGRAFEIFRVCAGGGGIAELRPGSATSVAERGAAIRSRHAHLPGAGHSVCSDLLPEITHRDTAHLLFRGLARNYSDLRLARNVVQSSD